MPNRRHGRAAAACIFCRQKKLKCDAVKPTCGNCLVKGIDCRQGTVVHKPRPTNNRIAQLESENEALRRRFSQGESGDVTTQESPRIPDMNSSPSQNTIVEAETPHPEAPDNNRRRSRSLYHGPTSTAYDDTQEDTRGDTNMSEEWSRHLLFAETARQRQLEPLNYAASKLDFDGVDPEIGTHLLSIYWSRQLYTAQIIYRPAFMRDMACNGPYFSKLLLNAIFFVVSKHCPRPELRSNPQDITTAGWRFRQRFAELLRDSFDKSEITTLQALLIMSNALFSRCDERSLSWLYAGNAFNMIIDLGLHVLPLTNAMSAEELEIRKRVLWGAYLIDKIQCLLQGRPPLLRQVDFNTPLEFLDEYDELDQFQSLTYTETHQPGIPSMNVTLLTKLCEVSIIIERILCDVYSESARDTRPSQDTNVSERIKSDLNAWRNSLPLQIDYLSYPTENAVLLPQSLCLLALYNILIILSQRPLITRNNTPIAHESITACTTAANQIVQILRDYSTRFSIPSAPYMLSYATYISATIHARIVAQKGKDCNAFHSLLFCRNILIEHTWIYAAAGKARGNLDKMIDHLGISLTERGDDTGEVVEQPV
ncbi:hypothetical protein MW887_011457 [Aspergillus wentii]|nr:hypothetical protein MW887_011457 [Aspergillus wentii]